MEVVVKEEAGEVFFHIWARGYRQFYPLNMMRLTCDKFWLKNVNLGI